VIDLQIKQLQQGDERKFAEIRGTMEEKLEKNREELLKGLKSADGTLSMNLKAIADIQRVQLDGMTKQLKELVESNQVAIDRVRSTIARQRSQSRWR
jgi:hypothetical protein